MVSIIREQTIQLGREYKTIKQTITTTEQFSHLAAICSFDPRRQSLTFKTEKIHPLKTKPRTTPVLLLFSNPHPRSVAAGMFLSEPRQ